LARRLYRVHTHRARVAREILASERHYVSSLQTIVEIYIQPMNQIVPSVKDYSRSLFSELEVILGYNSMLLRTLSERIEKWSHFQCLGDVFLKMTDFLRVYTQYVNNFNSALTTISLSKQHPQLGPFLQMCAKDSRCKGLDLASLLILPIQRIPRYVLLLEDMVRHTTQNHADFPNLRNALWKMKAVAEYVNDKKREADNIHEVLNVQEKVGKIDGVNLAVPHRRYIREGFLNEIRGPSRNKHYYFLFNDLLLCTKQNASVFGKVVGYQFLSRLSLNETSRIQLLQAKDHIPKFAFQVESDGVTLTLSALSSEELDLWVADLQTAIHKNVPGSVRPFTFSKSTGGGRHINSKEGPV